MLGSHHRDDDPVGKRPAAGSRAWSSFTLFGETLLTGVLVAAFSVVVVTLVPAVSAGTSHLRRHLAGEVDSVRAFAADFVAAARELWLLAIGSTVVVGVLAGNAVLVSSAAVPGGLPMAYLMVALAVGVGVVALRAAALWRRGGTRSGTHLLREAARRSVDDPAGSGLVLVAIGVCAVLVWMLLPLALVAPGLLALALVAVEQRGLRH